MAYTVIVERSALPDLKRLPDQTCTRVDKHVLDGTTYYLCTPLRGACHDVLQVAGVAPPKTLHQ